MSTERLYRVEMRTVAYVVAESEEQAMAIAEHAEDMGLRVGAELPGYTLSASEVRDLSEIREGDGPSGIGWSGWDARSVPLGGGEDKTIAEILGHE